jgi:hypothetical protein
VDKKALLAHGTTPSFPAIFEEGNPLQGNQYIQERIEEMRQEFERLLSTISITERIQRARFNFTPIVGKPYYLYYNKGQEFLSMIKPEEWGDRLPSEYIGCYKLTTNGVWIDE